MNKLLQRSHQLEVEIGKSLERNEFSMLYQPKIDLTTGQVLGAEALMRWQHPEWGAVPPSEFIPIAERSSLIQRVFDFSLRTALENARRWIDLGIAPGIISVNVSAANLRRDDFARRVRRLMAEFPIDPIELELEVTETLLLDDEELFSARMRQLKTIGVRLAIDDFGTRYTGFNILKRLPLDSMKIDRCFIRGIHQSFDMRTLCSTIIAMARHMKLRTVAEGIEEPEELDVMQQIGCDAGQGYLFQRPATPEDFIAFLRAWPLQSLKLGFGVKGDLPVADLAKGI
jgi:EAL domain-containing protein (putative c-di-GMP-specific phosphodiesterase class I)